jgi:hypothetical protein
MAAAQARAQALAFLEEFEEMFCTLLLCGFTSPVQHFCLIKQEGLDMLASFGDIPDEMFDRTVCTWENKDAHNPISFGIVRLQKLKAVAFLWVRKCQLEGTPIVVADLNPDVIQRMGKEKSMAKKEERQDAKAALLLAASRLQTVHPVGAFVVELSWFLSWSFEDPIVVRDSPKRCQPR